MRIDVVETPVYTFDELSDEAKEVAYSNYRESGLYYHEWYDHVYEDAKECAYILGIEIEKIYFSGFWSQGDGACFVGDYYYSIGSVKNILAYAPKDEELHAIAKGLAAIQKRYFWQVYASVKQSGHYSHSGCTDISVYTERQDYLPDDDEQDIKDLLRRFMDWIYNRLEAEYDYLTSDEVIQEHYEANEIEFYKSGEVY